MCRAAYRGGVLIGMNSSVSRPPDEIPVQFIDWPFLEDNPNWERHLELVKKEKPKYAVAPDVSEDRDLNEVLHKAHQLDQYANTVIVIPKNVKPDAIPPTFRVGVPAQEKFGGVPWPVWEYRDVGDVHILGGSPERQRELSHYMDVKSVDTASPLKGAQFGRVWKDGWSEEGYNYYDRIERSMENLLRFWQEDVDENQVNLQKLEIEQVEKCPLPNERKARPRDREDLCLGGNEEVPFPGRAYFYRDDTLSHSEWQDEFRPDECQPQ